MPRSLSNPVNNLYEGIHKIKCKYGHDEGKYNTCKIIHKGCDCFLEQTSFEYDLKEYKCLCCDNNCQKGLIKLLKKNYLKNWKK